jgi:GT2 family glycosyltransferase
VAFTDDDCRPERSWLRVLAKRIATSDGIAIGGHTTNGLPNNRFAAASQVIIDLVYQFYNPDPERSTFFASNNFACPVQAFRELGGFDERFFRAASEDRELCDRWLKSGRALVFAPDAVIRHYHDLDLRSFCRQHFNYGRGAYCFHRRRVERGATKFEIQVRFHVEAMRHPFRRERGLRALLLLSTLLVWQGANAAGFFYEVLRARFASQTGR